VLTAFTVSSGAAVEQNAAAEVTIKGFQDAFPERTVSLFKPLLPAPLELVSVVVDNPVKGGLLGSVPGKK